MDKSGMYILLQMTMLDDLILKRVNHPKVKRIMLWPSQLFCRFLLSSQCFWPSQVVFCFSLFQESHGSETRSSPRRVGCLQGRDRVSTARLWTPWIILTDSLIILSFSNVAGKLLHNWRFIAWKINYEYGIFQHFHVLTHSVIPQKWGFQFNRWRVGTSAANCRHEKPTKCREISIKQRSRPWMGSSTLSFLTFQTANTCKYTFRAENKLWRISKGIHDSVDGSVWPLNNGFLRLRTRSSAGYPEKLFEVQVAESFSKGAIVNIERFTISVYPYAASTYSLPSKHLQFLIEIGHTSQGAFCRNPVLVLVNSREHIKNWLVVSNIFYFPFHKWNVILPIDFHIFQRGRSITNQKMTLNLVH